MTQRFPITVYFKGSDDMSVSPPPVPCNHREPGTVKGKVTIYVNHIPSSLDKGDIVKRVVNSVKKFVRTNGWSWANIDRLSGGNLGEDYGRASVAITFVLWDIYHEVSEFPITPIGQYKEYS